jgi:type IV pilus assembly protein PilX
MGDLMKNRMAPLNRQTGVVLVISLIMLLLLALIGVTGMQVTSLEEKMAGNAQDQNVAFQAAESTLKEAEIFILASSLSIYDGSKGLLDQTDSELDYFDHGTWTAANSSTSADFGEKFTNNLGKSIADPRYIIKKVSLIPASGGTGPKTVFKITARAEGLNPGTQVILQEIFERTN